MKLISMTDFILEQTKSFESADLLDFLHTRESSLIKIENYAKFLKTPLNLGMFVPCDENGNIFEDLDNSISAPELFDWQEYRKSKEKVIFKDFVFTESQKHAVNNNIQLSVSPYGLNNERLQLTKLKNGKFHTWFQLFTVEDLIQCDLECTMSF